MNQKGIILISTLWIIAILSFLSLGIGSRVSMELRLGRYNTDRMKALYLATAGIAKCQDILSEDKNKYDSLYYCGIMPPGKGRARFTPEGVFRDGGFRDGFFVVAYKDAHGAVVFGMADEERRININTAERKTLANIFRNDDIAEAVMDWRGAANEAAASGEAAVSAGTGVFGEAAASGKAGEEGDKDVYYDSLENPYKRKKGDFAVTEELLLVKGVTRKIFNSVKEYVTVFGDGKININTAPKRVLLAVGLTEAAAQAIIRYRSGPDGTPGTSDDNVFTDVNIENRLGDIRPADAASIGNLKNSFTVKSNYFKLESRGMVTNSRITRAVTAVLARDDKCGGKIIAYQE